MSGEMDTLVRKFGELKATVFQMNTQIDTAIKGQTTVMEKINGTLTDLKSAIMGITEVSKSQVAHEKDIDHIKEHCKRTSTKADHDIEKLYSLVGAITPDRIKSIETRLERMDKRVDHNAESDKAQDKGYSALFQKITFALIGFGATAFFAFLGWLKLGGK